MRIATFNANSLRARLDAILSWIKKNRPDVLCLQETKVVDGDFPALAFTGAGYSVVFRGGKSYNGVAIVSREKPSKVRFGFDDGKQPDETRLVYAKVGPVHVVNTYVPQGREIDNPMYKYKLEWFRRLKAYFDRNFSTRMKLVWVGDLNVAPKHMDIHNADRQENHVCFHIAIRKAFGDTVAWGFEDIFRKHRPEPEQYSFFDYRTKDPVQRKMGWRVDHILATPPLAKTSTDARIDLEPRLADKPSDHTFVVADFNL